MNDAEAHRVAQELAILRSHLAELAQRPLQTALDAGTWGFDANGTASRQYRVPFGALSVVNHSSTATLVIEAGANRGQTPTTQQVNGPGIFQLKPGTAAIYNVHGYVWTVYGGGASDLVEVQVFANAITPAWR